MVTGFVPLERMEFLIAYFQNPSVEVRNQLVKLNTGLVRKIAHQVSRQCAEPYEDLEQIGYLGLIRAIERFNPNQSHTFSSFAVPFIRGEMLHFLRDKGSLVKIPRRWQELQQQGQQVIKKLTVTFGRLPTDIEIAQALKISIAEWYESKLAIQNRSPLSLDASVSNIFDCSTTLGELLPDTYDETLRYRQEDQQQLQSAMNQLEEKARAAIECVFLRELPRLEAAQQIGVSPITVTRHLHRGVKQLMFLLQSPTSGNIAR